MARPGKYEEWLQPEKLDQITNWAANGLNNEQIAESMGVDVRTLYDWQSKFDQFSQALKNGRKLSVQAIENQFFKNAYGMLEETTEIIEEDQVFTNGKWVATKRHVRKTTKKIPPNTAAQIFFLKNKAGYSDNPEQNIDVEDSDAFFTEAGL